MKKYYHSLYFSLAVICSSQSSFNLQDETFLPHLSSSLQDLTIDQEFDQFSSDNVYFEQKVEYRESEYMPSECAIGGQQLPEHSQWHEEACLAAECHATVGFGPAIDQTFTPEALHSYSHSHGGLLSPGSCCEKVLFMPATVGQSCVGFLVPKSCCEMVVFSSAAEVNMSPDCLLLPPDSSADAAFHGTLPCAPTLVCNHQHTAVVSQQLQRPPGLLKAGECCEHGINVMGPNLIDSQRQVLHRHQHHQAHVDSNQTIPLSPNWTDFVTSEHTSCTSCETDRNIFVPGVWRENDLIASSYSSSDVGTSGLSSPFDDCGQSKTGPSILRLLLNPETELHSMDPSASSSSYSPASSSSLFEQLSPLHRPLSEASGESEKEASAGLNADCHPFSPKQLHSGHAVRIVLNPNSEPFSSEKLRSKSLPRDKLNPNNKSFLLRHARSESLPRTLTNLKKETLLVRPVEPYFKSQSDEANHRRDLPRGRTRTRAVLCVDYQLFLQRQSKVKNVSKLALGKGKKTIFQRRTRIEGVKEAAVQVTVKNKRS